MRSYDVVIVGGGIAGGFLARHLKIEKPELSVLVLETSSEITDFKVGESTVEVAAHYMVKRLNLGTYLYQHHLPKNGLRFFFDSEKTDLPLHEMSEIGSDHFPFYPSFQLERAKLERDVLRLNRELGIDVELGAKATGLELAKDQSGKHTVTFEKDGAAESVQCRWVCDASGRRHFVARSIGQKVHKETRLNTAAAWARYENVAGLDAVTSPDPEWKKRIKHSSRHLSTNHLMYDGYWIWFIPLAGDLMSVGAVYDKDRFDARGLNQPKKQADFESFVNGHRAAKDLLAKAKLVDFQAYAHLPYFTDQYFNATDRWALTGEAGAFTDPFYSPGSDFIATANEFIVKLITTDLDGGNTDEMAKIYNAFYTFKYESTLRLYAKLYPVFGSFDVFKLKFLLDFNNYYNTVFWPFLAEALTDTKWLGEELRLADRVLKAQEAMSAEFGRYADALRTRGDYFTNNRAGFHNGLAGIVDLEKKLNAAFDNGFRRDEVQRVYGHVFAALFEKILGEPGLGSRKSVLAELNLTSMFAFKEITDESLGKLLTRVGMRLASELKKEFPDAGIEKVLLVRANGEPSHASVFGKEGARIEAVEPRAAELWNARADSLATLRL